MSRFRRWLMICCILIMIPTVGSAAAIYELQDLILDKGIVVDAFTVDSPPTEYVATLSDLSSSLGLADFEILNLSITKGSLVLGNTIGPGSFSFDTVLGESYFVNVFVKADPSADIGLFNVTIDPVPVPPAVLLLGSGLFGLIALRHRVRK